MLLYWHKYAQRLGDKGYKIMESLLLINDPILNGTTITLELPNQGSKIDFESEKEAFIERNRKILESSNSFEYWDSFTEEERKATLQELQVLFESLSEKIDTPFYLSCVLGFEERYQHLISVQ